jgi:hypothetical protein
MIAAAGAGPAIPARASPDGCLSTSPPKRRSIRSGSL